MTSTPLLEDCHSLCLPIISRGVYDIVVQKDGAGVCVGKYDNKGSFGELALMYNTPRAATIIATQEGALWGLVSGTKTDDLQCCITQKKSIYGADKEEPLYVMLLQAHIELKKKKEPCDEIKKLYS